MSSLSNHLNEVRKVLLKVPLIKQYAPIVEEKTKVNIEYFVVGGGLIVCLCLFAGFAARNISNVIGFAYPLYATIRAIETEQKDDDTEWLTYWTVFSFICVVENFIDWILFWVPFFYPLKVFFLLWLMIPKYKGAAVVYQNVIRPIFLKHQDAVEAAFSSSDPKKVAEESKKD